MTGFAFTSTGECIINNNIDPNCSESIITSAGTPFCKLCKQGFI